MMKERQLCTTLGATRKTKPGSDYGPSLVYVSVMQTFPLASSECMAVISCIASIRSYNMGCHGSCTSSQLGSWCWVVYTSDVRSAPELLKLASCNYQVNGHKVAGHCRHACHVNFVLSLTYLATGDAIMPGASAKGYTSDVLGVDRPLEVPVATWEPCSDMMV